MMDHRFSTGYSWIRWRVRLKKIDMLPGVPYV